MAKPPEVGADYTDEEIAKRRDGGLRALLKTPPQPRRKRDRDKSVTPKGKKARKTPDK